VDDCCHTRSVWSSLVGAGLKLKVLVCIDCGKNLDTRPLRDKDLPSGRLPKIVSEEPEGEEEAVSGNGTGEKEEVTVQEPTGPEGVCAKHGGCWPECDTGAGKAHHCANSGWGRRKLKHGPCSCVECHSWPEGLVKA
jgi:hypothetical protein